MNRKIVALMISVINAGVIFAADTESLFTEQTASAGAKSGGAGWLTAVALIFALGGIAAAAVCFLRLLKLEAMLPRLKKSMAEQSKLSEQALQDQSIKISKISTELNRLRAEVSAMNRPAPGAPAAQPQPAAMPASPAAQSVRPQAPSASTPGATAPAEKFFFVVPVNNMFSSPSQKFEPGRTLYCMTVHPGSNRATFEYCDDSASATIAKRSISRFVESGCTIVEGQDTSFSRIRTVKPGEAVRSGSGWVIERKAQIELI